MGPKLRPLAERFWAKVDQTGGPDACWPWTGSKNPKGYGYIRVAGRLVGAHVVAWEITHGPLPPETPAVRHVVCRNRPCCNPAHLAPGTQADNMRDMVADGMATCGERNPAAKLTESAVLEIRRVHAEEGLSDRLLARRFGVHRHTIGRIISAKLWPHILKEAS